MDNPASHPPRFRRYSRYAQLIGAATLAVSLFVLFGWLFDVGLLKSALPGRPTMKPNTAICFLLAGASLLLFVSPSGPTYVPGGVRRLAARSCAVGVTILALATFFEYVSGINLGIDNLLFTKTLRAADDSGRMATASSLTFIFLGSSLLLLDAHRKLGYLTAELSALVAFLIGVVSLLGYFYGIAQLYNLFTVSPIAMPTALLLAALGLSILLARPERGLMSIVTSEHRGGVIARRFLPAAVIVPFVLGWLRLKGQQAGLYGTEFGLALFVTSIALLAVSIWWAARSLNDFDARREHDREMLNDRTRQLAESENHLRAILAAEPECVKLLAEDGSLIDMNPAGLAMIEADALEQVKGGQVCDLALPEHRHAFMEVNRRVFAGETAILEFEIEGIKGSRRWLEMHATPLRDKNNVIIAALGITRDVVRRQAEDALRESQRRLEMVARASSTGFWDWDIVTNTAFFSPEWKKQIGYQDDEIPNRFAEWEKRVHPDDLENAQRRVREYVAQPQGEFDSEFRFQHKDGSYRWILARGSVLKDSQGKPLRMLGSHLDITDRKLGEEALRSKNEELATMTQQLWQTSKLATMGELAASIAHELNNPLATVALRTETLLLRMPAAEERKALEIIEQEVDRMANLVGNLLQFSRRSHRQISSVNPIEEIANSVDLVHYHLRSRKVAVVREFPDSLPMIQADRQQLRQLFLNLLTNASDAMAQGGTVTVRASATNGGQSPAAVNIEFTDTGAGINSDDLQKVWEPFFTTKAEGKGTGLGLAICRRIVEEHGGLIGIESRPGAGTTVRLSFPFTSAEEQMKVGDMAPLE